MATSKDFVSESLRRFFVKDGFIGCFDGWHHFNENLLMSKRWYIRRFVYFNYDLFTMTYLLQL